MKLAWERDTKNPLILYARAEYNHGLVGVITPTGLRAEHMDPIQDWCVQNKCGVRTSFDMFKFKNEAEISMFLLRWG